MPQPLPPSLSGLPVVGNAIEYFTEPLALFQRGYDEHGSIFSIRIGPRRAAVLLGPENNLFVFKQTDRALSLSTTFKWLTPLFTEKFPLAAETDQHRDYRPALLRPLKGKESERYIRAIRTEVEHWMEGLGDEGEFELVETFGRIILDCATRVFMGDEVRDQLADRFPGVFKDFTRRGSNHIARNFLSMTDRRSLRARLALEGAVGDALASRRANGVVPHDDYLQVLMDLKTATGDSLSDEEIFGLSIGLVWAGYPTTWGHITWALIQLLQHPGYLASVVDQVDDVIDNDRPMDGAGVRGLDLLELALKETERMRATVVIMARQTVEAYDVGGFHVPAGWLTIASPAFSHQLPGLFDDPQRYRPERFAVDRRSERCPAHTAAPAAAAGCPVSGHAPTNDGADAGGSKAYTLIGFGGGTHKCIGEDFAVTEAKILIGLLLRNYELELLDREPVSRRGPRATRPKPPVRVRYRRR